MNTTTLQEWFKAHEAYFSYAKNGYKSSPVATYLSTLPLIDRGGKVVDLGCGNGMLLKFLLEFTTHELVPYGIDINRLAIEEAMNIILPTYRNNFYIEDIIKYDFRHGDFDIVITPYYPEFDMRLLTSRIKNNLTVQGKIIIRIHDDVLQRYGIRITDLKEKIHKDILISKGAGMTFCILKK